MTEAIPVAAYGLGPIGLRIADRLVFGPAAVELMAAVDVDEGKIGRDLGALLERDPIGLVVTGTLAEAGAHRRRRPGVCVLATSSRLTDVAPQVFEILEQGWNVLSTCEELTFPAAVDTELARKIDDAAKSRGVAVLGAGINPGFLLDALVLTLTLASTSIERIEVRRVVDTNQRRLPLQKKAGVGMPADEFEELARQNRIGHVGLRQSAHLLASGLGWPVERYEETIVPVTAGEGTDTPLGRVEAGHVLGQRQHAELWSEGRLVVRYDLEMSAGAEARDEITVIGLPTLRQSIQGGVNGDIGTEAVLANLVPHVARGRPGLLTMTDVVPSGSGGRTADRAYELDGDEPVAAARS